MRAAWPLALLLLSGCAEDGPQTIVLVTFDTLHVRATEPYNPEVTGTPNLTWFASRGVVFENVWSQVPLTLPSHGTILSGLEPLTHGALLNGDRLPDEVETLPEILRDEDYTTAAFVSLGVLRPSFNLSQGFDHYDSATGEIEGKWYRAADQVLEAVSAWWSSRPEGPTFLWVHLSDPHSPYLPPDAPPDVELRLDGRVIDTCLLASRARCAPLIELPPGKHELAWVPIRKRWPDEGPATRLRFQLLDPDRLEPFLTGAATPPRSELDLRQPFTLGLTNHAFEPIRVRVPFRGYLEWPSRMEVRASYAAEVSFADRYLGRLRELVAPEGDLQDTLWILVSDHGEGLFNQGVVGHADYVFEDQLRALWIIAGNGIPAGTTVAGGGLLLADVAPTVLDVLGLPVPSRLDGRSQTGCWTGAGCRQRRAWWAYGASVEEREVAGLAVYAPPFKCLWHLTPRSGCFQLLEDPWEADNLAVRYTRDPSLLPPQLAELSKELERRRLQVAEALAEGAAASGDNLRMLRDLGYVD